MNMIYFIIFNILEKVFVYMTPFLLKYTINTVTSDDYELHIGALRINNFYTFAFLFILSLFLSEVSDQLITYNRTRAVQRARPIILEITLEHLSWMKMEFF